MVEEYKSAKKVVKKCLEDTEAEFSKFEEFTDISIFHRY